MEEGQYVRICVPIVGPGGSRQIMLGKVVRIDGCRAVVDCRDGRSRFLDKRVLQPISPLEILAEQADD